MKITTKWFFAVIFFATPAYPQTNEEAENYIRACGTNLACVHTRLTEEFNQQHIKIHQMDVEFCSRAGPVATDGRPWGPAACKENMLQTLENPWDDLRQKTLNAIDRRIQEATTQAQIDQLVDAINNLKY
jgi:hypothetical protein